MTAWIAQHFFHPALVVPWGVALVASPIIIHLINRMRFRKVRFAAMEFLLESQQRNRRRLLIEQLLLLLLRILIVLGLLALIARLILDPAQLSLFRGAKSHHVVLLDDSGSMQNQWSDTTAFAEAVDVVKKLAAEGAHLPDTQRFTLIRLSEPDRPLFVERRVNEAFVNELETKLENLRCSHRSLDLTPALDAARELFADDTTNIKHLHIISDFRLIDWSRSTAVAGAVRTIADAGVEVNLVRTVPERSENLAVTALAGDLHVAAVDVPLRLNVTIKNFGEQVAEDVGLAVLVDGEKLPMNIRFDKIEAGDDVNREFDVTLHTPGRHGIRVGLEGDALEQDNTRFLAVDITESIPVLIIDGDPSGEEGVYVADALAADPGLTGLSPLVEGTDYPGRHPLDAFGCIYLLNVPELSADAIEALAEYARGGGGLVWFLGDAVKPSFYNEKLYSPGERLFPVPLASARQELAHRDETLPGPDLRFTDHPLFRIFQGRENPFVESVRIDTYLPAAEGWDRDDQRRQDGVATIAALRNNDPILFEHRFGKGRVVTSLTSAGPVWNGWARNPSYVVFQLELQKHVARSDRTLQRREVGDAIQFSLNPAEYLDSVEIAPPEASGQMLTRLKASRKAVRPENSESADRSGGRESGGDVELVVDYRDTDSPGIYSVRLFDQNQASKTSLIAYNVPVEESDLQLATDAQIRAGIGDDVRVQIQQPGSVHWIQGRQAGHEVRKLLLLLLFVILLAEQLLAYRLSYHPKAAGVPT